MPNLASFRILLNKSKWFLYENCTAVWDFTFQALAITAIANIKQAQADQKVILYVGEFLPPRIARLAKWSKKSESFYTILLCHERGYYEKFINKGIDQTILFRNTWHLKRIVRSLPTLYIAHGFAPKSKAPYQALQLLRKYQPNTPFVADYQDVLAIYYGINPTLRWLKHELPYEKLLLQNADGIVAHSLEPCEGMKLLGIKKHGKRLFFPLYCDNDSFGIPNSAFAADNIHLVYAGGVVGSHRDKHHYGATQFHWLINYLTEQKIHFHIYPSPTVQKADYEEYEQIAEHNKFFHFHQAVSQSALSGELSKYHYGIMPFFRENSGQSDLKYKYATTLKLFNYLEAGIPIMVGGGVLYQSWLVERYKLGIIINRMEDFKDVRKLIEVSPYTTQVNSVLKTREILSLQKHMPRLTKFYEELNQEKLL